MKLVDILARDMSRWPEGFDCLSQLKSGYIINGKGFDGRAIDALQVAEETRVAGVIVTRDQWQEARDALLKPAAVEWDGKGLPPVGCKVEIQRGGWAIRRESEEFIGAPVTVLAVSKMGTGVIVITVDGGAELGCEVFRAEMARAVRTPEQIAEEELARDIETLMRDTDYILDKIHCQAVIAAGYRKVNDGNQKA